MFTIKQVVLVSLLAIGASSPTNMVYATDPAQPISVILSKVTLLERPAAAAEIVAKASKINKERVALAVVASIAKTDPDLLAAVVGVVISEVPSAAAKVASTAAQLVPDSLFDIAKAAAASAPKESDNVALALAALRPNDLLEICLAIGRGAPSEAGRVVIPLASAFPMQSQLVYSGLVHGAPEQEAAISEGLLKALPGLGNTAFGQEVRKTRSGLASGGTTVKRKVAIVTKTLDVIKALAAKLEQELKKAAKETGGSSSATVSGFAGSLLTGAITVDTKTGEVKVDTTKLSANSDLGQAFAKTPALSAQFVKTATTEVKADISNTNSALNTALKNVAKDDDAVANDEVVTVILSKSTIRKYNN